MKIAIIVLMYLPGTDYGGVTTVAADHASALAYRGHSVTVLTSNLVSLKPMKTRYDPEEQKENIRIMRFKTHALKNHFSLIISLPLLKWLNTHAGEFDVFHIHYAREIFAFTVTELLLRKNKKVFLQSHGMLNRRDGIRKLLDTLIVKSQFTRAAKTLALQSIEYAVHKEISPVADVLMLHNGINLHDLPQWDLENDQSSNSVLFLSRLHPRKRVMDFIHAAKILLASHPNLNFVIIGPDGGDRVIVEQELKHDELLRLHVDLVGSVDRDAGFYAMAKSRVYVLPSVDEPFSMALIEALAIGVPTVVTNRNHVADLLREHDCAEIVAPNPESLASGIDKYLTDPALCKKRSKNGRNLVANHLTIAEVVSQLEKYYAQ